jgi:hypothetical protein
MLLVSADQNNGYYIVTYLAFLDLCPSLSDDLDVCDGSLPCLLGTWGGGVLRGVLIVESSELVDEELDPEDPDEEADKIESKRLHWAMVLEREREIRFHNIQHVIDTCYW